MAAKPDLGKIIEEFKNSGFDPDEKDLFTEFSLAFLNGNKCSGKIRILQSKKEVLPGKGYCRVLMRSNKNEVLLNHWINTDTKLELHQDGQNLKYEVSDYSDVKKGVKKTVQIQFRTPQFRDEFVKAFNAGQKMNQEIYQHMQQQKK